MTLTPVTDLTLLFEGITVMIKIPTPAKPSTANPAKKPAKEAARKGKVKKQATAKQAHAKQAPKPKKQTTTLNKRDHLTAVKS